MQRTTKGKKWLISLFVAPQSLRRAKKKELKDMKDMNFWLIKSRLLFSFAASQSCGAREEDSGQGGEKESSQAAWSMLKHFCTIIIRPDMKMVLCTTLFSCCFRGNHVFDVCNIDRLCSSLHFLHFGSPRVFLLLLLLQTQKCIIKNCFTKTSSEKYH